MLLPLIIILLPQPSGKLVFICDRQWEPPSEILGREQLILWRGCSFLPSLPHPPKKYIVGFSWVGTKIILLMVRTSATWMHCIECEIICAVSHHTKKGLVFQFMWKILFGSNQNTWTPPPSPPPSAQYELVAALLYCIQHNWGIDIMRNNKVIQLVCYHIW